MNNTELLPKQNIQSLIPNEYYRVTTKCILMSYYQINTNELLQTEYYWVTTKKKLLSYYQMNLTS